MSNNLYPVFLKVHKLNLLIVGGGEVALEKLNFLLKSSPAAKVTLVGKQIKDEIRVLSNESSNVSIYERGYASNYLTGKQIAILATEDHELNLKIRKEAKDRGILVNVADNPDLCDFYMGSIVNKGDLKIAISTNGKSPTIAKRLKEVLNDVLPNELDQLLQNMKAIRDGLKGNFRFKVKKLNELTQDLVSQNKLSR